MNTVSTGARISPIHAIRLPDHSAATHLIPSSSGFRTLPLSRRASRLRAGPGFAFSQQARHGIRPYRVRFPCGLAVHFRLLPTSPRGDAVSFRYGPESACPEGTLTPLSNGAFERTGTGALAGQWLPS